MSSTIRTIYYWEGQTLHEVEQILTSRNDIGNNVGKVYLFVEPGILDVTKPLKTCVAVVKNNTISWMNWV